MIAHVDATHASVDAWGAPQTVPHALQLFGSKRVSTQAPLQATSGGAQLAAQLPLEHT